MNNHNNNYNQKFKVYSAKHCSHCQESEMYSTRSSFFESEARQQYRTKFMISVYEMRMIATTQCPVPNRRNHQLLLPIHCTVYSEW